MYVASSQRCPRLLNDLRDLGPGGTLEADPIKKHVQRSVDAELLTPASAVCSYFVTPAPYSLLIICPP